MKFQEVFFFNYARQSSLVACVAACFSCVAILTQEPDSSWLSIDFNRSTSSVTELAPITPIEFQLDLNKATQAELTLLPKIGAKTADRILEYRKKNGGFTSVEELIKVRGIGPKTLKNLRPFCYVKESDEETEQP